MKKGAIQIKEDGSTRYFISENYFYKSDTYYSVLRYELEGFTTVPSSTDMIEAFVVPICLEKARRHGISVCPWEISYGYLPLPAIVYGIHYFSDPADYSILKEGETAQEIIKHITNVGRYPFCYQPIADGAEVIPFVAVFGKTTIEIPALRDMAAAIYATFHVPLLTIVAVAMGDTYLLSSLSSARYSKLSREDRNLLKRTLGEC